MQNELLRSAYQIAQRKGVSTNWEAFENNIREELLRQSKVPGNTDVQIILRATCTAKTYRIIQDHQQRVVTEKKELDEKLVKLNEFICRNPKFADLEQAEQDRLKRQASIMSDYSLVLWERIAEF